MLEDANLKLGSVLSDVLGKIGRAILQTLIEGQSDPETLADLARGTARKKRSALVEALHGRIRDHRRRLGASELVTAPEQALADIDAAVEKPWPIHNSARLLRAVPGVNALTAQVMVAEIGVDMARFPTAVHRISCSGLCPRSDESAGKRRSTRVRKGAPWLKTALGTAA